MNQTALSYDEIVDTYGLTILQMPGDFAIENGDLATTKDGDIKLSDTVYSGLFRLVQAWRYNAPHIRALYEQANFMRSERIGLDDKMNKVGEDAIARIDISRYPQPDPEFAHALWAVSDEQGVAEFGHATYSGCVVLLLSGELLRFKDDIEATGDEWAKAAPLFHGCSFGKVIVASANGFRHEDEWAKTRPSKPQQQASQEILATALRGHPENLWRTPGRCAEVVEVLSMGGGFERLAANLFAFAHNVALRRQHATKP